MKQWEKYAGEVSRVKGQRVTLPSYDKVLISTELVLDDQSQLREGNRVHGENDVRMGGRVIREGGREEREMKPKDYLTANLARSELQPMPVSYVPPVA